jgi:hypothetical protein
LTNRVHVDAPAGVVEIEGEKDFVEGLLSKLFPLLEEAGFGSRPPNTHAGLAADAGGSSQPEVASSEEVAKARGKKRSVPPKGHSCADRIISLKNDGFFKRHHTTGEIVEGLKSKGWTHNSNQVGAARTNMFGRNEIQRTKEGSGSWKYFWDRD